MATVGPAHHRTPDAAPDTGRGPAHGGPGGVVPDRAHAPSPLPRGLRRPRVEQRLDAATTRRLTVVVAGAGWGKSTAVAAWCATRHVRAAWLTLEPRDDSVPVFWHRVVEALRASGAVPRTHDLARLQVPPTATAAFATRVLRGLESLPAPALLVLDDFQHLRSADVLAAVGDLVRYARPLHLVVVGRADPPLSLRRMSLDGQVDHLRAEHLAFDAADVRALAVAEGVPVTARGVRHLLDRTEGWPVGVRLGLMHGAEPGREVLAGFGDGDRAVAEYLLEEVLARQAPDVRHFLLRTSVASTLTADLAEAIVPGSPADRYLEDRVTAHDFVTAVGAAPAMYRFHPLLRDMLRGRLRFEDPDGFRDAHARAARWLMGHDEPLRALEHAAEAGSWDLFGEVFVESAAALLPGPQRAAVLAAAHRMPLDPEPGSAWCELCAGAVAGIEGRIPACRQHVVRARRLLPALDDAHRPAAEVLAEILDAHAARGRGDVAATAAAASAAHRSLARAPWPFPAFSTYRGWARDLRATGLFWSGRVDAARTELERMLRDDDTPALGLTALNGQAYLALCDAVQGRYASADARAAATLGLAEESGWSTYEQLRPAYAAAAIAGLARGDWRAADRALAYGWAADVGGDEPVLVVALHAVQAQVAVASGRTRAATAALLDAVRAAPPVDLPPVAADLLARAVTDLRVHALLRDEALDVPVVPGRPTADVRRVCRARTSLAAHQTSAADEDAQRVLDDDADLDVLTRVEALLVAAGAAEAGHDAGRAESLVREALAEADDEGVVLPFVRAAPPVVRQPVERVTARRDDPLAVRVRSLLVRRPVVVEPSPLVAPLTDRELAILTALATMQSNAEIADELFVSVNTVKAHLKALFRKLDVGSRRGAVHRGRELGLLP
ncbi:LuxR C-terminal-related transcriptional regulator [Cellulomonas biazotea]|uniref:LuxR C-terminal-related transcriptional regulator n=4 Tax=Cellulomonas biazotea TaxID=1709 RepID=UPI0035EB88E1